MTSPPETPGERSPLRALMREPSPRIGVLVGAMLSIALALYVGWLWDDTAIANDIRLSWWMLAAAFLLAEVLVIHVHFRSEAHTFSLSEFVIVVSLFFAAPWELVVAEILGATLAMVFVRRQQPLKLAFNLAQFFLATAVVVLVFRMIMEHVGDPFGPAAWGAALAAVVAGDIVSGLMVTAAICLAEARRPELRELTEVFGLGTLAVIVSVCLGLLCVSLVHDNPVTLVLFVVPLALVLLAYKGFANERQKARSVESLYRSMRQVQGAAELQAGVVALLDEARWLFRADLAQVVLVDEDAPEAAVFNRLGPGEQRDLMVPMDAGRIGMERIGPEGLLVTHGGQTEFAAALGVPYAKDLMAVVLESEGRVLGLLVVAQRLGDVDTFGADDLGLLRTYASHVVLALEKGRLQRSLSTLESESEQLERRALTDPLTGLGNRALLMARLEEALARRNTVTEVGVLFIDLDDFKQVNDTLGHEAGDRMLTVVADRLRRCLRGHDTASRPGGDEFVVIVDDLQVPNEAVVVADRIARALEEPVEIAGRLLPIRSSIGIARGRPGEITATELLARADASMYQAKSAGKGRRAVYGE